MARVAHQSAATKHGAILTVGVGGGGRVAGAAAAILVDALEEIFELGPLLGSQELTNLVMALLANLLELRIHLVVNLVVAVLHIPQYVPDLFLLIGRELEFGGQPSDRSRRIWPRLQECGLRTRAEDAPVRDRMSYRTKRDSQNKYQHDQRERFAIRGSIRH